MFAQEIIDSQDLLDQFWSDCYRSQESNNNHQAVEDLLRNFRNTLDDFSITAAAIDRDDPLDEIIRCSEEEGFMEVAQLLSI